MAATRDSFGACCRKYQRTVSVGLEPPLYVTAMVCSVVPERRPQSGQATAMVVSHFSVDSVRLCRRCSGLPRAERTCQTPWRFSRAVCCGSRTATVDPGPRFRPSLNLAVSAGTLRFLAYQPQLLPHARGRATVDTRRLRPALPFETAVYQKQGSRSHGPAFSAGLLGPH